jgi:hypothetical protein
MLRQTRVSPPQSSKGLIWTVETVTLPALPVPKAAPDVMTALSMVSRPATSTATLPPLPGPKLVDADISPPRVSEMEPASTSPAIFHLMGKGP